MKVGRQKSLLRLTSRAELPQAICGVGIALLMGCDSSSSSGGGTSVSPYSGFAYAMISADYSSSQLNFQGLENGLPSGDGRTLLTGESGIPWPIILSDTLYFFNRSTTSSNFRTIDTTAADGAPGTQIRTPDAGNGDPHAALLLSEDRLLLAHYTAGKLIVVNPKDGTVTQQLDVAWDLGSDTAAQLRPEALYKPASSSSKEIYVVHQARKADFSGYNGSQQIFILKDDGKTLTAVDVDTATDKVQGIKLNVFNPQIIDGKSDPLKPIVAGFCTIYDSDSPCTSGFEQVDLAKRTSNFIYDLTTAEEKGNGSVVGDKNGKFYAAVAKADGSSGYKSQIKVYEPLAATNKVFYEIADANYAAYALGYDLNAHRLYVGEKKTDGTGQFSIFDLSTDGSTPTELSLTLPPAEISFVP